MNAYPLPTRRAFLRLSVAATIGTVITAACSATTPPAPTTVPPSPTPTSVPPTPTALPTETPKPTVAPTATAAPRPKILMILREHSVDMEYMLTREVGVMVDALQKADYKVVSASPSGTPLVGTSTTFAPDIKLRQVDVQDYAGFIVPCLAVDERNDAEVRPPEAVEVVKKALGTNKPMAMQYTGWMLLQGTGVSAGGQSSGVRKEGNIITSGMCPYMARRYRGTDDTPELLRTFLEALKASR